MEDTGDYGLPTAPIDITIRTLHFAEIQRYDIFNDEEVVDLLAVTNLGTYKATIPVIPSAKYRSLKESFKQYVLKDMSDGHLPHEVEVE